MSSTEQRLVLRNFVDSTGRITRLPARAKKRHLVLEYVAGRFKLEREYAEGEVNAILAELHDDYVTLRRLLVDDGLLTRAAGIYRRVDRSRI